MFDPETLAMAEEYYGSGFTMRLVKWLAIAGFVAGLLIAWCVA